MMVGSGARGNVMQVRQIAGMRGLVANPRGEIIPRPIKSNFREGLSVLEYFISTHGARKGLADTALRTADSGYLTRRLVDVAQELIVRDDDCGSIRGHLGRGRARRPRERAACSRPACSAAASPRTSRSPTARCIPRNTRVIDDELTSTRLTVRCDRPHQPRSAVRLGARPATTIARRCAALCYGTMLATGKLVDLGEAVGIIAAQSIGEPGTQLTMRTFHTGGVAGEDITHGLPRVVELFEARTPEGRRAPRRELGRRPHRREREGRAHDHDRGRRRRRGALRRVASRSHLARRRRRTRSRAGDRLVGDAKTPLDPKKILEIKGIRETQQYLVDEVQKVYREQGVSIHDKHIEVIVRQMLRRVAVLEARRLGVPARREGRRRGATPNVNRRLVEEGKRPAEGRPELMGITKASLATESWLSAASFQETTRVLTEAAIEGKNDGLEGLKENVIIGKLIPAGTGMPRYREIRTEAPDYEPLPFYSCDPRTTATSPTWLARRHVARETRRGGPDVAASSPGAAALRGARRRLARDDADRRRRDAHRPSR